MRVISVMKHVIEIIMFLHHRWSNQVRELWSSHPGLIFVVVTTAKWDYALQCHCTVGPIEVRVFGQKHCEYLQGVVESGVVLVENAA